MGCIPFLTPDCFCASSSKSGTQYTSPAFSLQFSLLFLTTFGSTQEGRWETLQQKEYFTVASLLSHTKEQRVILWIFPELMGIYNSWARSQSPLGPLSPLSCVSAFILTVVLHLQQREFPLSLTEMRMRRQFQLTFFAQRASGQNFKLFWEVGSNGLCFGFSPSQHEAKPHTSSQNV